MATLGELLTKEREEAGISLQKAAEILKVRKDYLLNVENDGYDKLPPDVYLRGFLKSYARLLDLDEKKVIEVYKQQREIVDQRENPDLDSEQLKLSKGSPRLVLTPELFLGGLSVLIVLGVIAYFLKVSGSFSRTPMLEITRPLNNETVQEEKIVIQGRVDEGADLEINGQKVNLKEEGGFETELVLMPGVNQINLKTENKFGKATEKQLVVNHEVAEEKVQETARPRKILTLKVESEPVWISVESGEESFSETLAAYTEKILEIREPMRVTVGKANGVYFVENGKEMEIFGEEEGRMERTFEP